MEVLHMGMNPLLQSSSDYVNIHDKSRTTLLAQYRAMEKLLELAEQQVKTGQESVNILKREMGRLSKQLES